MWEPVRLPAGLKGPESYKRPLSLTLVRFISDARTAPEGPKQKRLIARGGGVACERRARLSSGLRFQCSCLTHA